MVRDFSQRKKAELERCLDSAEKNWLEALGDSITDFGNRFAHWMGILSLESYTGNVLGYQRKMMDMNNTTKKELSQIFENVYNEDAEYGRNFRMLTEEQQHCIGLIQTLTNSIGPSFTIAPAASIKKECKAIGTQLKDVEGVIASDYQRRLDDAQIRMAGKAVKGTVTGMVAFFGDMFSFGAAVASGEPEMIVSKGWELIDNTFGTIQQITGLGLLGVGVAFSVAGGKNKQNNYNYVLSESDKLLQRSGIADELESHAGGDDWISKQYKDAAKVVRGLDAANDIYNTIDTTNHLFDKPKKPGETLTKLEKIEKDQKDYSKGISTIKTLIGIDDFIDRRKEGNMERGSFGYYYTGNDSRRGNDDELIFGAGKISKYLKDIKETYDNVVDFHKMVVN